ncbi:MAG TPA: ABC transporter permease [Vicinamibacterales bacterium]|nr:ABC transporter permease [Vicinamibacterales bacterium]
MHGISQDVRVALRQLARRPAFSAIVLATLALGIGATTTFFSILNGVALRPLPFADADRLVAVDRAARGAAVRSRLTVEQFISVREAAGIAEAVAYVARPVTLSGEGGAVQAAGAEVSGDLFALLGTPLLRGRSIGDGDTSPVAVIGHDLWTGRFGASDAALGASIAIDGVPHTIVGIAPAGFAFPADARIWLTLRRDARRGVDVAARLRDGVPPAEAAAALAGLEPSQTGGAPDNRAWTIAARPLRDAVLGSKQRDAALILLLASGVVLVVACANLAGLLLAYVSGRRHELAVRAAIGAARWRLVRQVMTESALLAVAGGALGVLVASWGTDLFVNTLGKPGGASWLTFSIDARVVAFAFAAAAATSTILGVAPAIGASRVDIRGVLQEDQQASGSRRRARLRGAMVAAQVALSLGLVTGGASIVTSALAMDDVHPGFERAGLVVVRAPLPDARFDSTALRMDLVDSMRARLAAVAGVSAVSAISHAPLVDRNVPATGFIVEGWTATASPPAATFRFVDADYFDAMRIPVRRGRAFTAREARDERSASVIINETMARRHWPDRDPIGARLRLPGAANPSAWFTVVGVVGDVAQRALPGPPESQMYYTLPNGRDVAFVVRTAGESSAAVDAVRTAAAGVDPAVAVTVHTMDGTYRAYAEDRRLQGFVLGSLGAVALLVAALGVFGVMSLTVAERHREIAIRAALGGTPRAILQLILGSALRLVSIGVGAGLLLAFAATAFLSSIFFGLRAFDPALFAGAATLLGGAALAASWWPARTAARVDPMAALKLK